MALFNTAAASRAANDDGEFQIAARLWNTNLRLDASGDHGAESYLVQIRDGRIAEFSRIDSSSQVGSDVTISAPIDDWREMLRPIPKPFFQDLMAAMTREGFRLDGDLPGFRPYYRATCRLVEIMRNIPAPQK
ncbi:MAG TPA: hypothetical protein VEU51_02525 [Candidatus Acidoferrales bacterium]|nr:hypothetical protein [Candidatus Acidoferrales bacterium]